jgi:hypothetical protein
MKKERIEKLQQIIHENPDVVEAINDILRWGLHDGNIMNKCRSSLGEKVDFLGDLLYKKGYEFEQLT